MVRLIVDDVRADEPFVRRGQDAVMERLLQGERLGGEGREACLAVVDRQAQPVPLRGVSQVQVPDGVGQVCGIAFLEAQGVDVEVPGQVNELTAGLVLAEVVANDSDQEGTSSADSDGTCVRVYPVESATAGMPASASPLCPSGPRPVRRPVRRRQGSGGR